jgi:hypothetical protein
MVKMLLLQCNPSQNSGKLFCEYWQTDSKVYRKRQMTQNSQNSLEGEEQSRRIDTTCFKFYYKALVIKTVLYKLKKKCISDTQDRFPK